MSTIMIGEEVDTGKKIELGDIERRSGMYILGKPGMGKSNFIENAVISDYYARHLNDHGLFFLDPHGDSIKKILNTVWVNKENTGIIFLDPEDEEYSFGINPLACDNLESLKERTNTYTRAFNTFYKIWEEDWGGWLQLILQNTLYVFLENPDYTLAEVPLFFTNENFRDYLVSNVKYNLDVKDFWQTRFGSKRESDQQKQVDAALTRISTLLGHPYVKHIIGQKKTTIPFSGILRLGRRLFLKLSASLSPDIKKFIGTIVISELLHAVRNRLEYERDNHFSVYIDEFQNFANSEDLATLITEARKYGIATTIAHQERFGQLGENKKLLGATLAAANKVFFQLTVKDAEELALEFVSEPKETELKQEPIFVLSPHPIEDIWEKGHDEGVINYVRKKYFYLVDLLKRKEDYYQFNPAYYIPSPVKDPSVLQWDEYKDWAAYRSSADMIKQGISLLNEFYYDWMQKKYTEDKPITSKEIELILKVIECLGGVLGFWLTMEAYVPEEARNNILGRMINLHGKLESGLGWTPHEGLIPTILPPDSISIFRGSIGRLGLSSSEIDKMIQWRIKPFSQIEREFLIEIVRCNTYSMAKKMSEEIVIKYYQSTPIDLKRLAWQIDELDLFIRFLFLACPPQLASYPVKIPSGRYEEKLQPERTQADLIKEMEQSLSSLPRFAAWTKTLDEDGGVQKVKVKTIYVGNKWKRNDSADKNMPLILYETHKYFCTPRDQIEKEIAERYAKWRKAAGKLPPSWTPA